MFGYLTVREDRLESYTNINLVRSQRDLNVEHKDSLPLEAFQYKVIFSRLPVVDMSPCNHIDFGSMSAAENILTEAIQQGYYVYPVGFDPLKTTPITEIIKKAGVENVLDCTMEEFRWRSEARKDGNYVINNDSILLFDSQGMTVEAPLVDIIRNEQTGEITKYNYDKVLGIKDDIITKLREARDPQVKNMYGFFYALVKNSEITKTLKNIYFIGCGYSHWYEELNLIFPDKHIFYVDAVIPKKLKRLQTQYSNITIIEQNVDENFDILPDSYVYMDISAKIESGFVSCFFDITTALASKASLFRYKWLDGDYKGQNLKIGELVYIPYGRYYSVEKFVIGTKDSPIRQMSVKMMKSVDYQRYVLKHFRYRDIHCYDCFKINEILLHIAPFCDQLKNIHVKALKASRFEWLYDGGRWIVKQKERISGDSDKYFNRTASEWMELLGVEFYKNMCRYGFLVASHRHLDRIS